MNPRVLLWLEVSGLKPADIARKSGEDIPRVSAQGQWNIWTVLYSEWIQGRWLAWAKSLGFKNMGCINAARTQALLGGRTDEEFDVWLQTYPQDSE